MSKSNRTDEVNKLRALQEEVRRARAEKDREDKKSRFPELMRLAITAMRACKELTWLNHQKGSDAGKKAKAADDVSVAANAFVKAYREIVLNSLERWWGAELQKAYVQGAPESLLVYYLSDNPDRTKRLAYSLKKAADDYVCGWEMLGRKSRKDLQGPIDRVGNDALAVQVLIEQLRAGDETQKTQAKLLELVFEDPISALGKKVVEPEVKNPTLGEKLGVEDTTVILDKPADPKIPAPEKKSGAANQETNLVIEGADLVIGVVKGVLDKTSGKAHDKKHSNKK